MKKLDKHIQCVGIIANPDKPSSRAVLAKAVRLIEKSGRKVCCDVSTAALAGFEVKRFQDVKSVARACQLLLALGGDGTVLRVARETAGTPVPLLGVNLGTLGFLTASPAQDLEETLDAVWSGQCLVEARTLIQAEYECDGKCTRELALNDFVISHGAVPRLIELEVWVDNELLTRYRGDGLIVSSPTGSTAYSLAAGGAVVSPNADVFALTPICAHTLSSRSVILSLSSTVTVRSLTERVEASLAGDGRALARLQAGDVVRFRRSRHAAHLVRLPEASFFDTLRRKLNWSGSSV